MKQEIEPNIVFEVSWEVCNRVGGIYAVLSTKAKTLQKKFKDQIIFIGPDLSDESPYFIAEPTPLDEWADAVRDAGLLNVKTGRWDVPGKPLVVLVDFKPFIDVKNQLYTKMWEWYKVDSIKGYGDYDDACLFAYASAKVIENYYNYIKGEELNVIAHFNEWTVGMGALYIKHQLPAIGTIFTTHATSIGRSIAGNNKELYKYFYGYNGDQMAAELNMAAKHSVEKATAHHVDCFTTVSEITALECKQLLDIKPDVVTPNAFEMNFVPTGKKFDSKRNKTRKTLLKTAASLCGYTPSEDSIMIGIGGRYEYKNKGIDLFIDSVNFLRINKLTSKEVIAFIFIPAWVYKYRESLKIRMSTKSHYNTPLENPFITHHLHNTNEDKILNQIKARGFTNSAEEKTKIIFVPVYLTGDDGIFNNTYYDMLTAMDMTVFPSYYEPWGYTPLESIAFMSPTITTDLAGFGKWSQSQVDTKNMDEGVCVLHRNDDNYWETVQSIAMNIVSFSEKTPDEIDNIRTRAQQLAKKANWNSFMEYYYEAYQIALSKSKQKIEN